MKIKVGITIYTCGHMRRDAFATIHVYDDLVCRACGGGGASTKESELAARWKGEQDESDWD